MPVRAHDHYGSIEVLLFGGANCKLAAVSTRLGVPTAAVLLTLLLACKSEPFSITIGRGGAANAGATLGGASSGGVAGNETSGGVAATSGGTLSDAGAAMSGGTLSDAGAATSGGTLADAGEQNAGGADAGGPTTGGIAGLSAAGEVLDALRLANDYFVAKWPDPTLDIVKSPLRPSNLWTRAVYYEGLMELYGVERDADRRQAYYDYAVSWGESPGHPWQLTDRSDSSTHADAQACGQTYLDLYAIDPRPERIEQIRASVDRMLEQGISDVWTWIDAIQMAMPVFAKLGAQFDEPKYFEHMWLLYADCRNVQGGGLFNAETGLWWRDAKYSPGDTYTKSPNDLDVHWSRGNGWVFAGLARVLEVLPATDPHRAQYLADFRAMAQALLPLQRPDGFWHENLVDPAHCAALGKPAEDGPETSGTALFVYGYAWGIRRGVLDAAEYGPALVLGWDGLRQIALQPNGFLGWVQSTGARPCGDSRGIGQAVVPDSEDFGLGCFLLAGSEVMKLSE